MPINSKVTSLTSSYSRNGEPVNLSEIVARFFPLFFKTVFGGGVDIAISESEETVAWGFLFGKSELSARVASLSPGNVTSRKHSAKRFGDYQELLKHLKNSFAVKSNRVNTKPTLLLTHSICK